jgi:hypothetical protein
LWGDAAVRDNETGLVWDRNPDTGGRNWVGAINHCAGREVGGRKGFQLPMLEQLASLVDSTGTTALRLPDNHPFQSVQAFGYWSATTSAINPLIARRVEFSGGLVLASDKVATQSLAWCVRGGQTYDGQDVLNAVP